MAEQHNLVSYWSIGELQVRLDWSEPLDNADLEDFEAFLALVMKNVRRRHVARGANPSGLKPDAETERETSGGSIKSGDA